jgi:hypothetical protein
MNRLIVLYNGFMICNIVEPSAACDVPIIKIEDIHKTKKKIHRSMMKVTVAAIILQIILVLYMVMFALTLYLHGALVDIVVIVVSFVFGLISVIPPAIFYIIGHRCIVRHHIDRLGYSILPGNIDEIIPVHNRCLIYVGDKCHYYSR